MLSIISSTISSSDHLWIQVFRASWYVIQVVSSCVCGFVCICAACVYMDVHTAIQTVCIYICIHLWMCIYTENWFYLFLLPPNPNMEFCIFWVEEDIGGDMLSLKTCLAYGLDQILEGISCVCPRATYLCMCYRRWAVSQLECIIRMFGVLIGLFSLFLPVFPSSLDLELLDWHLKGHFTSGKLLYRMGKQCRKGSGCRWESHGRSSCSTAMTPATSKMSSQVSFVSTAQGIFNVMIWATFSTVLQSFINLALWFFLYCECPVHIVMYYSVMSSGHNYLHI